MFPKKGLFSIYETLEHQKGSAYEIFNSWNKIPESVKTKAESLGCFAVEFNNLQKHILIRGFIVVAVSPKAMTYIVKHPSPKSPTGITWIEIELKGSRQQMLNVSIDIPEYSDKVGGWTLYPQNPTPAFRRQHTHGIANCDMSGLNSWNQPVLLPPGKYHFVHNCIGDLEECTKFTFTSDAEMDICWKPVIGADEVSSNNFTELMNFIRADLELSTHDATVTYLEKEVSIELKGYSHMPIKIFNMLKLTDGYSALPGSSDCQLEVNVENTAYKHLPTMCASCFKGSRSLNLVPLYVCRLSVDTRLSSHPPL